MTPVTAFAKPSREENWLPILERATQEVFEIMLGCQVTLAEPSAHKVASGFTAIVGLAGALCGVVTVCCSAKIAGQIARGNVGGHGRLRRAGSGRAGRNVQHDRRQLQEQARRHG